MDATPWVDLLSASEKDTGLHLHRRGDVRVTENTPVTGSKRDSSKVSLVVKENRHLKAALEQCQVVSRGQLEGEGKIDLLYSSLPATEITQVLNVAIMIFWSQ